MIHVLQESHGTPAQSLVLVQSISSLVVDVARVKDLGVSVISSVTGSVSEGLGLLSITFSGLESLVDAARISGSMVSGFSSSASEVASSASEELGSVSVPWRTVQF